eukprot:gene298-309_t
MTARTLKRPFYVAVESYKFARMYPLGQRDAVDLCEQMPAHSVPSDKGDPRTSSAAATAPDSSTRRSPLSALEDSLPAGVELEYQSIDFTPAEYITLLFTDLGVLTPSAVSDELIRLLGKIPLDVQALSLDLVTIVGHKFGASKGVGALYINPNIRSGCSPMIIGGSQEGGLRAGTESVVLIAGFGEACRIAREEAVETTLHMLALQRRLVQGLQLLQESKGEQVIRFNGPLLPVPVPSSDVDAGQLYKSLRCLPNTVSVSFYGLRANKLLGYLKDKVACSAGSACHSGCSGQEVMSDVLSAIS